MIGDEGACTCFLIEVDLTIHATDTFAAHVFVSGLRPIIVIPLTVGWRRGSVVRAREFNSWVGRRSLAGELSRFMPDLWLTCDHFVGSVRCGSANQANLAFHPTGVGDHKKADCLVEALHVKVADESLACDL